MLKKTPNKLASSGFKKLCDIALAKKPTTSADYHWRGIAFFQQAKDEKDASKIELGLDAFQEAAQDNKFFQSMLDIRKRQADKLSAYIAKTPS